MTEFLLNVAGAAALLVYAVRMVRTGVERAFAMHLRRWLRASARSRLVAASSGAVVAMMMQSATAVAVLATGFVAAGSIPAGVGLAMLLGADVGSAVVVQALVLRPGWLAPLLLLAGVMTFLRSEMKPGRQIGRILVGLALIFIALDMIAAASLAMRDGPALTVAAGYLQGDLLAAFMLGAVFAWLIHSSVAAVLLIMVFAAQGVLVVPAAVALVLGANLGGSMIAVTLTLGADPGARQMIWSNVAVRGGGAAAALAVLATQPVDWSWLGPTPGQQVINLHLAFNLAVALVALPLVPVLLQAAALVVRSPAPSDARKAEPTALDPAALSEPGRALTCAAREVLHMGEAAETMLRPVMRLFNRWDQALADTIAETESRLDRMNAQLKTYLASLDDRVVDRTVARRITELTDQAANYEAAGDAVARIAFGLARKLGDQGVRFSPEGGAELADFHDAVLSNAQSALEVQMTGDPAIARTVVSGKEHVRDLERRLQHAHLARLRQGNPDSAASSNVHQEVLRELKLINTCFVMVAYPILTESGDLLETRLRDAGT